MFPFLGLQYTIMQRPHFALVCGVAVNTIVSNAPLAVRSPHPTLSTRLSNWMIHKVLGMFSIQCLPSTFCFTFRFFSLVHQPPPQYDPNSLAMFAVCTSAKCGIILVKSSPSRLANLKIRAFCTRKDFLAQCVSFFSCS